MKNFYDLRNELDGEGVVIRYKSLVITTEFCASPAGEFFCSAIWSPIESEEETGLDFHELRLENVTPWEPLCPDARFDTEGEALFAAMQAADAIFQ